MKKNKILQLNTNELINAYKVYQNNENVFKDANPNILALKGLNPDVIKGGDLDYFQFYNPHLSLPQKDAFITEYGKLNDIRTDKGN